MTGLFAPKTRKKIICIPDSFKGSLSSREVSTIMKERILNWDASIDVTAIEVADGGEGTVDAFLSAIGGQRVECLVAGPRFKPLESFYGIIEGNIAVIEMAAAAGLPLVGDRKNPELTTTYGVGQLIIDALDKGCTTIIMGLGGSCTNDGGCGAASACGVRFLDKRGNAFIPTGGTLKDIRDIDLSGIDPRIKESSFITMCDIDNPLYGPYGAAYVFAPQKGADKAMVKRLDEGLKVLAKCVERRLEKDIASFEGGGAAGGMGAGMAAFFDSKIQMGIETVLDLVKFESLLDDCDLVFTGEGRFDSQSLRGKVVIGVTRRAKKRKVPVVAMVGSIGPGMENYTQFGLSSLVCINPQPVDIKTALRDARVNMMDAMDRFVETLHEKEYWT